MVINNSDPTRGSGPDKVTEVASAETTRAEALKEPEGSSTPDPARGGCLKFGWGCLPVLAGVAIIPVQLFF